MDGKVGKHVQDSLFGSSRPKVTELHLQEVEFRSDLLRAWIVPQKSIQIDKVRGGCVVRVSLFKIGGRARVDKTWVRADEDGRGHFEDLGGVIWNITDKSVIFMTDEGRTRRLLIPHFAQMNSGGRDL